MSVAMLMKGVAGVQGLWCSMDVGGNVSFSQDLKNCPSYGIKIVENDSVLNCQGHLIKGSGSYRGEGVVVAAHNVTVKNCRISDFYNGVGIRNQEEAQILNNTITDHFASGISIKNSSGNIVRDNFVRFNDWDGIFLYQSDDTLIERNTIRYNAVDGVHLFRESDGNIIRHNRLEHNDGHAIAPLNCQNRIRNNTGGKGSLIQYVANTEKVNVSGPKQISELILCNVSSGTISDISMDNGFWKTDGILVVHSKDISMHNLSFVRVRAGVYLYNSSNVNIHDMSINLSDYGLRFMQDTSGILIKNVSIGQVSNPIRINSSTRLRFNGVKIGKARICVTSLLSPTHTIWWETDFKGVLLSDPTCRY